MTIAYIVLGALSAYALAAHFYAATLPRLLVGLIYGFSPFIMAQIRAHTNMLADFFISLSLLLVLRALDKGFSWKKGLTAGFSLFGAFLSEYYVFFFSSLTCLGHVVFHCVRRGELRCSRFS